MNREEFPETTEYDWINQETTANFVLIHTQESQYSINKFMIPKFVGGDGLKFINNVLLQIGRFSKMREISLSLLSPQSQTVVKGFEQYKLIASNINGPSFYKIIEIMIEGGPFIHLFRLFISIDCTEMGVCIDPKVSSKIVEY